MKVNADVDVGKVRLEVSEHGRPVVWIANYRYICAPWTAVKEVTNSCVFSSRKEAIRWAKFSMRGEIDWKRWTPDVGVYPNEENRDDERLTPTFIATAKQDVEYGDQKATISWQVTVQRSEISEEFDWWAKTANGDWNDAT